MDRIERAIHLSVVTRDRLLKTTPREVSGDPTLDLHLGCSSQGFAMELNGGSALTIAPPWPMEIGACGSRRTIETLMTGVL